MNLDDTIVAIATPAGRGGIGVVRLSGPDARNIAQPMLRFKHSLVAGRATFGEFFEPPHPALPAPSSSAQPSEVSPLPGRIDEVVVTWFESPHSYTTEDVIEISAHGSPVVLRRIVELCVAAGARIAEPGEFTMRAFLNGRIDLAQAEAVRDLIDSQTLYQAKVAAQQLAGGLSRRLAPVKRGLVELIARLEAGIDFAEDNVSVLPGPQILEQIQSLRNPLQLLSASFSYGHLVHQGLTLAIVGRPNVGKSSLFNRLVERDRAIVTATPGTTRDLITEAVAIGGIPVRLMDTAGIRHTTDEAELIGVSKSREALADADLVLVVLDAAQPIGPEDQGLLQEVAGRRAIVVFNKMDLAQSAAPHLEGLTAVLTSATKGQGISELRNAILHSVIGDSAGQLESGFLTNVRHLRLVDDSLAALDAASAAVLNRIPHEMLLLDLYSALRPLDEITGVTTADDILNLIFSTFCIGK